MKLTKYITKARGLGSLKRGLERFPGIVGGGGIAYKGHEIDDNHAIPVFGPAPE